MGVKAKSGDIFLVPIDSIEAAVGVVVDAGGNGELYVVIFAGSVALDTKQSIAINQRPIEFAALIFDAKIWHADWPVVANVQELPPTIPYPVYKLESPSGTIVQSFDRTTENVATEYEIERLPYRKYIAPIRLEKAVKASHGVGDWDDSYDELLVEYSLRARNAKWAE